MKEMTKEILFSFNSSLIGRLNQPMRMRVDSTIYQLVVDEPFSFLVVTKAEGEGRKENICLFFILTRINSAYDG